MTAYAEYCRPKLADLLGSVGLDVTYTRARGAYLYRAGPDGTEVPVLDLVGGFGAGLFGHNHPVLRARLMAALEADVPCNAQSGNRAAAGLLAERLSALLPGGARYLTHFTNSGAEAVEAALKHAYKVRFDVLRREFDRIAREIEAFANACDPDTPVPGGDRDLATFRDDLDEHNIAELERFLRNPVVLAVKGAFHGKTPSALKLTFNKAYREGFEGLSAIQTVFLDLADMPRLEEIVARHQVRFRVPVVRDGKVAVDTVTGTTVIAFALEVIQGEGGIRPLPDEVLQTLADVHPRLGVPYLMDEIQSGCGRTGTFVAYEATPLADIRPEYVTLSKALGGGLVKIGAAMIREDVYDPDFGILHTSTFAEDELSCAVAHAALDQLTVDHGAFLRQVTARGDHLLRGLRDLAVRFPTVVREVRGRGLMIGVEFTDLPQHSPLFRFGIRQGFLSLLVASYLLHHHGLRLLAPLTTLLKGNPGKKRQSILRIQPPAVITLEECDRVLAALAEVFTVIARNNEGVLVGHLLGVPPDEATRHDPPTVPVSHPVSSRRADFDARVGFVVHPAHVEQVLYYYFPSLVGRVERRDLARWWSRLARFLEPDVFHTAYVASEGFTVEVNVVAVPYLPRQLVEARDPQVLQEIQDKVQDAVTTARELGDDHIPTALVGLGAYTSIVTDQGRSVNDFEVPITTGNAYTAGLMLQGLLQAAELNRIDLPTATAAVVGAAGNIGSVLATLLADRVGRLRLVGRDTPGSQERLERTRQACLARSPGLADRVTVHTTLDAVADCDIVTVATNSPEGRLIGPDTVKPGAVVSCASVPSNLSAAFAGRHDEYLVFDGGYARLPDGQVVDCIGLPRGGLAFGCMSETILLGLAGRDRSFARGAITPAQVEETLDLARRYGFTLGGFKLNEQPFRARPSRPMRAITEVQA